MKQIRSTKTVITNPTEPSVKSNILFKDFHNSLLMETQKWVLRFNSYKIVPAVVGTGTIANPEFPESYEFIKEHIKEINNPDVKNPITLSELNTIVTGLTLTQTDYTLKEIEIILEATKVIIGNEGFYGLLSTDLTIE